MRSHLQRNLILQRILMAGAALMLIVAAPLIFWTEGASVLAPSAAVAEERVEADHWPIPYTAAEPWRPSEELERVGAAPGRALLVRILERDYLDVSDVATGRFLRDFPQKQKLLERIDVDEIISIREGRRWIRMKAFIQLHKYKLQVAQLRFIHIDERWKIENLTLVPDEETD